MIQKILANVLPTKESELYFGILTIPKIDGFSVIAEDDT